MKKFKIIAALIVAAKFNYTQAQNLQNGLQACYPLDCNVTNMAATGSILDGTPFNVACTTGVGGVANGAYAFAGNATSYIELQDNPLLKSTTAVSFSGWVKFSNNTNSQTLVFAKNACSSYFEGYALAATVISGNLRLQVVKSAAPTCYSGTQHIVTGGTNLTTGVWYHVGFYAGTDSLKLFLNGAPEGTPIVSTTAFSYASTKVILGGNNQSSFLSNYFSGSMDNVRFYNRKLTNGEFKSLYTTMPACNVSGGPLLTDSLQACYPLDCNANDVGPHVVPLNGTAVGVTCATDRFGNTSGAYAFANSTSSYIELPNNPRLKSTTAVSFSGWVRFNSTTNSQTIVFTKNTCVNYFEGYTLVASKIGANLKLQLVKSSSACGSGTQHILTGSANLGANTWYHVGFYAGTDSLKIFLNGALDGTPMVSTTAFSYSGSKNVYLGGTNESLNSPLDGRMDEVRFYNRKVYNYEFAKLYSAPPNCTSNGIGLLNGLQACYPLNCNAINYAPTAGTPPSLDATTLSNVTCDTGHVGNLNGAYKFSGALNSYIELPNDARLKPNAISFSCWSKIDFLNVNQYIVFAKNPCSINFEGYALIATYVTANTIKYQLAKAPGTSPCANSPAATVLNSTGTYNAFTWHHVAFYMDGAVMKLYVDGAAAGSMSSGVTLNYDATTNVYLGNTNQSYNKPLNGSIDNVRFYNRELSLTEVNGIYANDPSCDWVSWCGGDPSTCREATPVGIEKLSAYGNKIEVYPNPSSGKFYISNAKGKSLQVYDINGKVVQHTISQLDETTGEITLEAAEGLYFVRILDANGNSVQTSKLILSK